MLISLVSGLIRGLVDADAVLAVVDTGVHHGPEVGELEAEDDVGVGDDARRPRAEMVRLREVHAAALVDDAAPAAPRRARPAACMPFGVRAARSATITGFSRVDEQPRRFRHRAGVALRRRGRRELRDAELLAVVLLDRLLLQAAVERRAPPAPYGGVIAIL